MLHRYNPKPVQLVLDFDHTGEPNAYSRPIGPEPEHGGFDLVLDLILHWHRRWPFFSTERPREHASLSEIRRWIKCQAIIHGNEPITEYTEFNPEFEIILFPKGKRRTTIW